MKRAPWKLKADSTEVEVLLYGDIGEDWWGDGISAKAFVEDLQALDESVATIIVRINSPGGDAFDGLTIYQALKRDKRKIITTVDGLAASAATLPMVAGDEVNAAETAMIMVHDPWSIAIGNSREFREMADLLDQIRDQIVLAYDRKDNVDREEITRLMAEESWLSASAALDVGLVDSVSEASVAVSSRVPAGIYRNTPRNLLGPHPGPAKPKPAAHRLAAARRTLELAGLVPPKNH